MGAQQRVYRQRISAVRSTKKITKAMELIAASRIVKAQQRVAESTPYAEAITETVTIVASSSSTEHILTTERENPGRVAVLVITSDRGLAGAYSSTALRSAEQLTVRLRDEGMDPVPYVVGPQGCRLLPVPQPRDGAELDRLLRAAAVRERPGDRRHADRGLPHRLGRRRHRRDPPRVYTEFVSSVTQRPKTVRLLPLVVEETDGLRGTDAALRVRAVGRGCARRAAAALSEEPHLERAAAVGGIRVRRRAGGR